AAIGGEGVERAGAGGDHDGDGVGPGLAGAIDLAEVDRGRSVAVRARPEDGEAITVGAGGDARGGGGLADVGDLDRRAERLGVGAEGLHADAAVIGGLFPGDGETVGRGRDLRAERAAAGSAQAAHRVAALRRRRFGGGGGGGRCARRAGRARRRGDGAAFGGRGGSGRRLRGRAADRARGDAGDGAGDGASEEREQ